MSEPREGKRYFSGGTLGQAVLAGAEALSVDPTTLAYEVLESRHTSWKGTRRIVIAVDERAPQRVVPAAPSREAVRPAATESPRRSPAPRTDEAPLQRRPAQDRSQLSAVELQCHRHLDALIVLCGLELDAVVHERADRLEVELGGPDRRRAIGRHGDGLRAFEQLLERMLGGEQAVRVDCDGFRAGQEEELLRHARQVAGEVLELGRSALLEPLSAAERRVVHLAVLEIDGVESHSEGDGFLKRVRISPVEHGADSPRGVED